MHYVISALANAQDFHVYKKITTDELRAGMSPQIERTIHIKGGTGVANSNLVTPHGVVTEVDEDDMLALMEVPAFQEFKKNGYIHVLEANTAPAPETVISDLKVDKGSSPLTLAHFREKKEGEPEILSVTDNAQGSKRKGRQAVAA